MARERTHLWRGITLLVAFVGLIALPAALLVADDNGERASGGNVLPPRATPHGYSLTDLAAITAEFNSGSHEGIPPTATTPFEMLYTRPDNDLVFHVQPGTMLYVPVVYSTGDVVDVTDKASVANLYFSPEQYGAEYIDIVVDGKVTSVKRFGYPVGAAVPQVDHYTTVAAFLTPLTPGTHEVTIRAKFDGALLGGGIFEESLTYTVIVK
jgi:hypothetical protein